MWVRRLRGICLLVFAAVVVAGIWTLPRLEFDSNILSLFPADDTDSAESVANDQLARQFEREALLLLGADTPAGLHEALPQALQILRRCDCFAAVRAGALDGGEEPVATLPAHMTPALLTPEWRRYLLQTPPEAIARKALRDLMTRPGGIDAERLQSDPLGSRNDFLARGRPNTGALGIDAHGYPSLSIDGKHFVLVRLSLSDSPYGLDLQERARTAIDTALGELRGAPGFAVIKTGALFYTLAGTAQAQREISTVGLGSMLGIVALFVVVFRRLGLLALAFVPIAVGVLAGVSVTYWLFGRVHVMALVFGAALVGVAIDYSLHFFSKRLLAGPEWRVAPGTSSLVAPLSLGMLTSVAGYLSFTATGFPGFVQIATLSSAGLVAAYATVFALYPVLLRHPPRAAAPIALVNLLDRIGRGQRTFIATLARPPVAVVVLAVGLLGLSQWQVEDDIRQMQSAPESLRDMDRVFSQHLGQRRALQYLLLSATDAERLLRRLEALAPRLAEAQAAQELGGFSALHQLVPSQKRQQGNARLWRERVVDSGALERVLRGVGVKASVRQSTIDALSQVDARPVAPLLQQLRQLPYAPVVFAHNEGLYTVVTLYRPLQVQALKQGMDLPDYAQWVDPVGRTNTLLQQYRHSAGALLLLAYLGIGLALWPRYGWRGALAVVAPPALASLAALSVILLAGQAISVFHMMALLLVLGIGVDYTLFVREQRGAGRATLLAIGLSTVTTVLSFGLLALSETHAIHSFGVTVFIGILLAFLLAPLASRQH